MSTHAHATLHGHGAWRHQLRAAGSHGNEVLTSAVAVGLLLLIGVQLVTVLALGSLIEVHLFVGVVLLGPLALKLASAGCRFARYYGGSAEYREKGPPRMILRATAPIFVAATIGLFATGVLMLLDGEAEGTVRDLHVVSFWAFLGCLALHALLNGREVLRHVRREWMGRAHERVALAGVRATLLLASILGGVLVAVALLSKITGFDAGD